MVSNPSHQIQKKLPHKEIIVSSGMQSASYTHSRQQGQTSNRDNVKSKQGRCNYCKKCKEVRSTTHCGWWVVYRRPNLPSISERRCRFHKVPAQSLVIINASEWNTRGKPGKGVIITAEKFNHLSSNPTYVLWSSSGGVWKKKKL